jgi:Kef-type K+ transport system membrane component KefB
MAFLQLTEPAEGSHNAEIILDILIVFVAAKLLAEIAERLRQPSVAGELLAGILIGPAVFGWVQPNELLTTLAELGVIFLLFRVGLELRDFELARIGAVALSVAFSGVVVPFLAGWGIMLALGTPQVEAAFLGAAMVATSVGITARVLAGKGLLNEQASKIILAAAVIDDILGLLVLATVSSVAEGQVNLYSLGFTAVLTVGFTLLVARWGGPAMGRIVPKAIERFGAGGGEFSLAIILLFGLSLIATYTGVAAIIGAFLAGMALSNSVSQRVETMTSGVTELLVPFFLVGIGLNLDVSVFQEPRLLLLALGLLVVAVLTKFFGCGLPALRLGRKEATRIGIGMIPRGEVGMVVAQLGLSMGVIPAAIYALVVFMSIGTTLIAPPLLVLAFKGVTPQPEDMDDIARVG